MMAWLLAALPYLALAATATAFDIDVPQEKHGLRFTNAVQAWDKALASEILADPDLRLVLEKARALLKTGLTAGSGYGEVWIRDLNTFIEVSLDNQPRGSKQYRGSAGVLGKAIEQLLAWAEENGGKGRRQKDPPQ